MPCLPYQPASSASAGWREAAAQIGLQARNVGEIAGLAVALVEADEYAEDLGDALGGKDREGAPEGTSSKPACCARRAAT